MKRGLKYYVVEGIASSIKGMYRGRELSEKIT